MLRRLFTVASAISLLLCAATVFLWARSRNKRDVFTLRYGNATASWIESVRSGVQFVREDNTFDQYKTGWETLEPTDCVVANTHFGFGGVSTSLSLYSVNEAARVVRITAVVVPFYGLLLGTTPLPLLWLMTAFRRRSSLGHCRACGYDLRASTDRCPECGTSIQSTAAPAENPSISN